jgi:proton-dependent oligopeptide transporter, POT family
VERGGLGFSDSKAGAIYGLYTAMVYLFSLPGGWVADRLIGARKAVLWGGIIIAAGHFCLTFQNMELFSLGLCLIVIGTGLLKPNVSSMVGMLYTKDDPRRDAGFSIFYMGINLGAFISPLICGYLGERINWHYGFAAAGIGMTLGVIQYVLGQKSLGTAGQFEVAGPDLENVQRDWRTFKLGIGAIAAAVVLGGSLVLNGRASVEGLADVVGYGLLATTVLTFGWLIFGGNWSSEERRRFVVVFVLFLAACLFWSAFEQAGSTLNLFGERNTDRTFLGYEYPASWFQSVNSLFIITLAPVVGWLWLRLGRREPSSPAKFAWGLFLVGAGFVVMALGAMAASSGVRVSASFLWICYFLHSVGELCLSPVGLSAMTRLAPVRAAGLVMGIWFLASSVGNYIGGRVASIYEAFSPTTLFWAVSAFCMVVAAILAALSPTVRRLSGDAEKRTQH